MPTILDTVGNTPIVELQRLNTKSKCKNIRQAGRQ